MGICHINSVPILANLHRNVHQIELSYEGGVFLCRQRLYEPISGHFSSGEPSQ
jgi:hypothetical protein